MKTKRLLVPLDLAQELFSRVTVTCREKEYTAADLLQFSKEAASIALTAMQQAVDSSVLASLIASSTLKGSGKRGQGKLVVDSDGSLWCELPPKSVKPKPEASADVKAGRVVLRKGPPTDFRELSLETLRARAAALSLDVSHLGRQKKAIFELIEEAENKKAEPTESVSKPAKKMFRTSVAVTAPKIIESLPPEPENSVELSLADPEDKPSIPKTFLPTKSTLDLDALIRQGKETDALAELAELGGGDEIDLDSFLTHK